MGKGRYIDYFHIHIATVINYNPDRNEEGLKKYGLIIFFPKSLLVNLNKILFMKVYKFCLLAMF